MQKASALLRASWALYKERFWPLLGITVIPQAAILVCTFIAGIVMGALEASGGTEDIGFLIFALVALIGLLIFFILSSVGQIALILSIREKTGIKESYKRAWPKLLSYWWVLFLVSLLVIGGFILFIIPAIILGIWFSFALYTWLFEGKKGMAALYQSREYVRGHFGAVLWRNVFIVLVALAIFLIALIPMAILGAILPVLSDVLSTALSVFLTPLFFAYYYLMYTNLREIKGEVAPAVTGGEKTFYGATTVVGSLVALALIGLLLWALPNLPTLIEQIEETEQGEFDWQQLQRDLQGETMG